MNRNIISESFLEIIRCPRCKVAVRQETDALLCTQCNTRYPIIDGIPLMQTGGGEAHYDEPGSAEAYEKVRTASLKTMSDIKAMASKIMELGQIESTAKVLSVGAGVGLHEQYFDCDLVAADSSIAMLGLARKRGLNKLVCTDALELPFGEDTLDYTIAIGLGTLFQPEEYKRTTIKEMKRVTRRNGQMFIATSNIIFVAKGILLRRNPGRDLAGLYPTHIARLYREQEITVLGIYGLKSQILNPKAYYWFMRLLQKMGVSFFDPSVITHGQL